MSGIHPTAIVDAAAKIGGKVRFEDHGAHGRVISVLPLDA